MTETIELPQYMDTDKNDKTLKMFGLNGLKFRGIELDNYGTGFDPMLINNGDAVELFLLQIKTYILRGFHFLLSSWNWCNTMHQALNFQIGQILIYLLYQFISRIGFIWFKDEILNYLSQYRYPITETELIKLAGKGVPENCAIIINLNQFVEPLPPMMPEPYLTSKKKLVVPTKKEIDKALRENLEYMTSFKLFKQNELFGKMMILSKCIKSCTLINVPKLTIYESTGELWQEDDNLPKLMEFICAELSTPSCHHHNKRIKLNNYDSKKIYIKQGEDDFELITEDDDNGDIDLTISLISSRQSVNKVSVNELLSTDFKNNNSDLKLNLISSIHSPLYINKPDLILNVNKDFKKNGLGIHRMMGFPIYPSDKEDANTEFVIYTDNDHDLTIDSMYKGIKYWQLQQ